MPSRGCARLFTERRADRRRLLATRSNAAQRRTVTVKPGLHGGHQMNGAIVFWWVITASFAVQWISSKRSNNQAAAGDLEIRMLICGGVASILMNIPH